ncbi:MAG: methionyl-tRNA formyltransferase [Candidatus Yanofskybacteria bacterium]|nr:methionyl-tRNA formyltransferase [Candidatus Yanofskybacteria bacterium]
MSLIVSAPRSAIRLTVASRTESRVVFFGTPLFAVPALRRLVDDGWPIAAVVTAPDRPVGRRMRMTPSPVKSAALELGLPVWTPSTLKDDEVFVRFSELQLTVGIVVAYGKLIGQRYLDAAPRGFLNIHPSLLPAYRGPSPIQSAILDGCANTGVSLMQLDAEMDHGPVVAQETWEIPRGFDAVMCEDELSRLGADLLARSLSEYLDGSLLPVPQNDALATITKKFERPDGRIAWTDTATSVTNRIRALAANPGTWTTWNGRALNIHHAHAIDVSSSEAPGTVTLRGTEVCVVCGEGMVALETIQLEGSTRQQARDFVNGRPAFIGAVLS